MVNERERSILDSDFYLISKALRQRLGKELSLDTEVSPDDIELLAGGYSGARVYRVPVSPTGNVVARIVPRSAAKAEVERYGKYVECFLSTHKVSFPALFHPRNEMGKADPDQLVTGLVVGEEMGVVILSDQRWTSIAKESQPVGATFSRTLVADEVKHGVSQALSAMEELRKFHQELAGDLDFARVFEFYNRKLPPALTVSFERSELHCASLQPLNELCAKYADREDTQSQLRDLPCVAFSPVVYERSHRVAPDTHVCWGPWPLYRVDVTGLLGKPDHADQELHFTGRITGTRYQYLTDRWRSLMKKELNGTPRWVLAGMSDDSALAPSLGGPAARSRRLSPPTDLLVAASHWVSTLKHVHLELDPPFWPSGGEAAPRFRKGVIHGDLHSGNILCLRDKERDPICYSLIDLEAMREDAPIAHDTARLELDLLLRALEPLSESGQFNLDEFVRLGDAHFAQAVMGYESGEPPQSPEEYAHVSQVLFAVRKAAIGDCSPPERLVRLLEHLWCVFFNGLQYFCYDTLPACQRVLAWQVALYFGTQARNPAAWLAASADPWAFRTVLSALTKNDTDDSSRATLSWLNSASQPTELERPLWQWDEIIGAARQQVFQRLIPDYWHVIRDGFSDIVARFTNLAVRSGPGTWTYEVPLTATSTSGTTSAERDVDEVIDSEPVCVLLGPPGCGKSTIGIHILSRAFREPRHQHSLPLLADLPMVAAKEEKDVETLAARASELAGSEAFQVLERELSAIARSPAEGQPERTREVTTETAELAGSFLPLRERLPHLFADTPGLEQRMAHLANRLRMADAQHIPVAIANQLAERTRSFIFDAAMESLEAALYRSRSATQPSPRDVLDRYLSHVKAQFPALLDDLWNTGSLHLVLDSLNEVAADRRASLTTSLSNLVTRRWGNRIVILSRQHNYQTGSLGLPEYSILELDRERFFRFVQKWVDRMKTPGDATHKAEELWDTFNGPNAPESAKSFSRSPLSLWMLLTLLYGQAAGIAPAQSSLTNRSRVFCEFVRRSTHQLSDPERSQQVAERLGFLMVENGNVTQLAEEEAKNAITTEFGDFEEQMSELERAGLVQTRDGLVRFNHQSIQEYCAARHLWRLGDKKPDSFREKIRLERWDESVHLLILFDESDTKGVRRKIFMQMLEERTFDLLAECFSHAESLQWEQVEDTIGATIVDLCQPLPFRREALLALGRVKHRGLDRRRIASWILRLFDNPIHEALWPDVLMVHVKLGEELDTDGELYTEMVFERKPHLERLLDANYDNPGIRTKVLEYLATGKLGKWAPKVVENKLLQLLAESRLSGSDSAFVIRSLQEGEVTPNLRPPYDAAVTQALLWSHRPTVQAALEWLGEGAPVSVSVLSCWLRNGWLDLFVEHKGRCSDLSDLLVEEKLLDELPGWRFKEKTDRDKNELTRRLSYVECLGARGDRWLPKVVELALLSAPSYQKLAQDFLVSIPNKSIQHASPLRVQLSERLTGREYDMLLKQALDDNPRDVDAANAAAFLLGQSVGKPNLPSRECVLTYLREFGDRLVESRCTDAAAWIRLLCLVSWHGMVEMVDDLSRWGWALYENWSPHFILGSERMEIFAALLMAFSKLIEDASDMAPYWERVFFWIGSPRLLAGNWTEKHFSQLDASNGANELLSSDDPRDILVAAEVVKRSLDLYNLGGVVRNLLRSLDKVVTWSHSPRSREEVERDCHFKLAIAEDSESCSFVCDMVAKGDRRYTELLLERFMSRWSHAEPPGIPEVFRTTLLDDQQAKRVFKSELETLGNDDGARGLAYLGLVDSRNMARVFSGCLSRNSRLWEVCCGALVDWVGSRIRRGALPVRFAHLLQSKVQDPEGDPSPAWAVLTFLTNLADRQAASVRLFVKERLSGRLEAIVVAERDDNDVREAFRQLLKSLIESDRAKTAEEVATINAIGEGLGQFFATKHTDLTKKRARQLQNFCTGLTGVRYSDRSP